MRRRHRLVAPDLEPRHGGPRRRADPEPASRPDLGQELLEPLDRHRLTVGQRPLGAQLEDRRDALRLPGELRLRLDVGEPLGGVRIAAANGQLGENRLGEELHDGDPPLDLALRDLLGLGPVARPKPEPRHHRRAVRREVVDLVLARVRERPLLVHERRLRIHPPHEREAEVPERAGRLVAIARGVGDRVRLEQHLRLAAIPHDHRAADVDERVRARALVAHPGRQLERLLAPVARLVGILREHRELGQPAVGARELGRLAERLEDRDRLDSLRPRGLPVADVPVEARKGAGTPAHGLDVAQFAVDLDRALDRRNGLVHSGHEVRGGRVLLEHGGLLRRREPVDEVGRTPVVRVRLAVRLERGGAAGGDERVRGDAIARAGGLGVVDDVRRIGTGGQQGVEDLAVQPAPRRDRKARPDRVARQLVAELHVRRSDGQELAALGLLRGRGPVRRDRVEQGRAPRATARPTRARPAAGSPRRAATPSPRPRSRSTAAARRSSARPEAR